MAKLLPNVSQSKTIPTALSGDFGSLKFGTCWVLCRTTSETKGEAEKPELSTPGPGVSLPCTAWKTAESPPGQWGDAYENGDCGTRT